MYVHSNVQVVRKGKILDEKQFKLMHYTESKVELACLKIIQLINTKIHILLLFKLFSVQFIHTTYNLIGFHI